MISIVVPLYNKEKVITKTLSSIQSQSYQDWECVIVDDGSSDNSALVVKAFIENDSRFSYYLKQNGGPSSARNYGIDKANGKWITFLDADDRFEPCALECFNKTVENYPKNKCFAFNFWIEAEGEKRLYLNSVSTGKVRNTFKDWYFKRFFPRTGNSLFAKDIIKKYRFKEYLLRFEDAEIMFNIMRTERFYYIDIPVMTYAYDYKSASCVRKDFNQDFFAHIEPKGKSFWEQLILYGYYKASFALYGEQAKKVYGTNPFSRRMILLMNIYTKWQAFKRRLSVVKPD